MLRLQQGPRNQWDGILLYLFEDCQLDTDRRELRHGGGLVAVEPQVFDLLVYLIRHRDRVVSKDELLASIWYGRIVSESALFSRINAVRGAIGDTGELQRLIKTLPRKGLQFVGEVCQDPAPATVAPPGPAHVQHPGSADVAVGAVTRASDSQIVPDKPSIAVLPFANMSGDADQDYFVDGVTEDIITALSKWRWFLVIARNSTFAFKGRAISIKQVGEELGARYMLEGSVRRMGNRVRVTTQLIDAKTDRHIWAERYDRDIGDIFAFQDEIAQQVVIAIDPAIRVSEMDQTKRKPPESMDAWDHFLKGSYYFHQYSRADGARALDHLRRAIQLDPCFAPAHARLALALTYAASLGRTDNIRETLGAALGSAKAAVALDGFDASAHAAASYALTYAHQHDAAVEAGKRAVHLNANYHIAFFILGIALNFAGQPLQALPALDQALRLSPRDPAAWFVHNTRSLAYYTARQFEAAHAAVEQALIERPNFGGAKMDKAAVLVRLGRVPEASRLLQDVPTLAFSQLPYLCPFKDLGDFEYFLAALEQAGLSRTTGGGARKTFAELQLGYFR